MNLLILGTALNLCVFVVSVVLMLIGNRGLAQSVDLMTEAREERRVAFATLVEIRKNKRRNSHVCQPEL